MIAYQSRRWQQQLERNGTNVSGSLEADVPKDETTQDQLAAQTENTDISSAIPAPGKSEQAQDTGDMLDIADIPTVDIPSANDVEEIPPPPPQAESPATSEEASSSGENVGVASDEQDEVKKAGETEAAGANSEEEKSETMQEPSDQHETTAPTNGFPVLSIGEKMLDRYEITQVLIESARSMFTR